MFQVDTRPWYLETHPEVPDSFLCLSQIAHDETWRKAAADYLKAVIRHCEEKYGDRIYGYFILGGGTTEWLSYHDHEEPHPIKEAAYKSTGTTPAQRFPQRKSWKRTAGYFWSRRRKTSFASGAFMPIRSPILCFTLPQRCRA